VLDLLRRGLTCREMRLPGGTGMSGNALPGAELVVRDDRIVLPANPPA
jgi:hypothetical protein